MVYRAQPVLSGKFAAPDFGPLKIDLKDVQWKDAFVTIAINDLRGTPEAIVLNWGRDQASYVNLGVDCGYITLENEGWVKIKPIRKPSSHLPRSHDQFCLPKVLIDSPV